MALLFWWNESPSKSAQKSTRESRPTKIVALESKRTLFGTKKVLPFFVLLLSGLTKLPKRVKR